jgi:hypothetical protein
VFDFVDECLCGFGAAWWGDDFAVRDFGYSGVAAGFFVGGGCGFAGVAGVFASAFVGCVGVV